MLSGYDLPADNNDDRSRTSFQGGLLRRGACDVAGKLLDAKRQFSRHLSHVKSNSYLSFYKIIASLFALSLNLCTNASL